MPNTLENFIHVCFILDESGSMGGKEDDVVNGFKRVIDEQKELNVGSCAVSLFKFDTEVTEVYVGCDINNIEYLKRGSILDYRKKETFPNTYIPGGSTSLYDAIGIAISSISRWDSILAEGRKPEKHLIVIMTDGYENSSKRYNLSQVRELIDTKERMNWTFLFMGTDIRDTNYANTMGFTYATYTSSSDYGNNYNVVNDVVKTYRKMAKASKEEKEQVFAKYMDTVTNEVNTKNDMQENENS